MSERPVIYMGLGDIASLGTDDLKRLAREMISERNRLNEQWEIVVAELVKRTDELVWLAKNR